MKACESEFNQASLEGLDSGWRGVVGGWQWREVLKQSWHRIAITVSRLSCDGIFVWSLIHEWYREISG